MIQYNKVMNCLVLIGVVVFIAYCWHTLGDWFWTLLEVLR